MPGGGEREVDGAEEQVRQTQADHEGSGGVDPQLDGAGQGDDGDQVTCRRAGRVNTEGGRPYRGTFISARDSYWPEVALARVQNVQEFIWARSS